MVIDEKNQSPFVSVIMPTFNQGDFIGAAIESVIGQTHANFELVIVNNHSTDHTEKVITAYSDPRTRYYKFKNHDIIAASRNFGIRKARGKYIAFLDSDDQWLQGKLEKQVRLMESDENLALSYVLFGRLHPDGRISGTFPHPEKRIRGSIFRDLYLLNMVANSGAMVRKSVFDRIGMLDENPKLVGVEDADMWLRISRAYRVDFVPDDMLLLYRVGDNNRYYKKIKEKMQRRLYLAGKYYPEVGLLCFFKKVTWIPLYCLLRQWPAASDS